MKRLFHKCPLALKLTLFKCYILYVFYDIGLWSKYTAGALAKFKSCYYKCVKAFGYKRFNSVTYMLCDLSLPSFDTVILNSKYCFKMQCRMTNNALVSRFLLLDLH